MYISQQKANAYRTTMAPDELIITADTIVWLDGEVMGKPKTREQAIEMLTSLSGHCHQVVTGVTLLTKDKEHSFSCTTDVYFCQLRPEEIEYYVDTYKPYDKAGAYGIQEWIGYIGVERIEGSYFNVMGLPVQRLYRELKQFTE